MKALTLTQPWATLVTIGAKRIETRGWNTRYRGPLAIHAGKGMPRWAREVAYAEPARRVLLQAGAMGGDPSLLPRGVVVATCELVDVAPIIDFDELRQHRDRTVVAVDDEGYARVWEPMELGGHRGHVGHEGPQFETEFGDYTPGRFAWLLADVTPLDPAPVVKGRQGLWEWDGSGA